jgi:tripartite-type tricarboxylate transporter receptor subunit TctC
MLRRFLFALGMFLAASASAQSWPQKPVRFIVPFPPGGATDISARLLGEKLTQIWGQQVSSRTGQASGAGAEAARAPPMAIRSVSIGAVMTANQHIYAS